MSRLGNVAGSRYAVSYRLLDLRVGERERVTLQIEFDAEEEHEARFNADMALQTLGFEIRESHSSRWEIIDCKQVES